MAFEAGPRKRKGRAGLTLVELMFALVIISIALFGIISMILQMVAMRENARENQAAREWVQQKIEEVKSRPFSDLRAVAYPPAGGTTIYKATFNGANTPSQLPGATGVLCLDYTSDNLCEIVAAINWNGRMGKGMYSMRNLYAK